MLPLLMMKITKIILFLLLITISVAVVAESDFPADSFLRSRIDFWKKVYTEISVDQWFIHDTNDMSIIYETVPLDHSISPRERNRILNERKKNIQDMLKIISLNDESNLNSEEAKLFKKIEGEKNIERLMFNMRFQQGMSEKFKRGLEESNKYLSKIKEVIIQEELPQELMYLPHVESSFDYTAYSKVGAAGIWQFMRSTARLYRLKQNYIIDERRDPMLATNAAMKLLKYNYSKVQSWPLAITAYNFGLLGIERAVAATKSSSLSTIIQNYDGRRFGFASKNFYVSFVAAVEIAKDPEKYFKNINFTEPIDYIKINLPKSLTTSQIANVLELDKKVLRDYNLSLRPIVFERDIPLPNNFLLQIPKIPKEVLIALDKKFVAQEEYKATIRKPFVAPAPAPTAIPLALSLPAPTPEANVDVIDILTPKTATNDYITSYNFDMTKIEKNLYKISVEIDETPGHYSDWLVTKMVTINQLNGKNIRKINFGDSLILPIKDDQISSFNMQRMEYHQSIIEDFFNNYKITGTVDYKVRSGDTVSKIITQNDIPLWLLRSYMKNGIQLNVGSIIRIPIIEEIRKSVGG